MSLLTKFLGNGRWNIDNVLLPDCDVLVVIVIVIKSNHHDYLVVAVHRNFRVLNNGRDDHFLLHTNIYLQGLSGFECFCSVLLLCHLVFKKISLYLLFF